MCDTFCVIFIYGITTQEHIAKKEAVKKTALFIIRKCFVKILN